MQTGVINTGQPGICEHKFTIGTHPPKNAAMTMCEDTTRSWALLFDDSFYTAAIKPKQAAHTFDLYRNVTSGKQPEKEEPPLVTVWRRLLS